MDFDTLWYKDTIFTLLNAFYGKNWSENNKKCQKNLNQFWLKRTHLRNITVVKRSIITMTRFLQTMDLLCSDFIKCKLQISKYSSCDYLRIFKPFWAINKILKLELSLVINLNSRKNKMFMPRRLQVVNTFMTGLKSNTGILMTRWLGLSIGIGISYYLNTLSSIRYSVLDPTDAVEFNSVYPMFFRWFSKITLLPDILFYAQTG